MKSFNDICFGGASLSGDGGGYGFGKIENPFALLEEAFDRGINYYDSAPIYGFGQSEITLGKAFKHKREQVKFISKSGVGWHSSKRVNMSNDPDLTQKMLEESLKRFDCDYIDVYFIHWPDKNVDIRFPLEVLAKAQEQGKIIKIGLSNTNQVDLALAGEVCEIEYLQGECNLFRNSYMELDYSKKIKTMGWGTFDKGILAGSVTKERVFEREDARSWAPWWKKSNWKEKVSLVNELWELGYPVKDLSLWYSLNNVDFPIIGFKTSCHLEQTQKILKEKISSKNLLEVSKLIHDKI